MPKVTDGLYRYDSRSRMAIADMSAEVVEAALDQPHPTPALRATLHVLLNYVKHRDRDRSRDGLRPPATVRPEVMEDE